MNNVTSAVMNETQSSEPQLLLEYWRQFDPLTDTERITIGVIMIIILVIGSVGNTTVLVLFSKYKSLRLPSNTLVANLSVADLAMCLLCIPILVLNCFQGHNIDRFECYFYAFTTALTGFVSITSFAAMAVDRCVVIGRDVPVAHQNDTCVLYGVMVVIWLVSAGGAALPFLGLGSYVLEGSGMSCTFDYLTRTTSNIAYNLFIQIFFFAIPLTIIVLAYLLIFLKVKSHEEQYFKARSGKHFDEMALRRMRKSQKIEKNELKAALSGLVLIVVFCVSWLPYSIICYYALFGSSINVSPVVVTFPGIFAKCSTVLNPTFYAFLNKRFRRKFILLFSHFRKVSVDQRINLSNDNPLIERRQMLGSSENNVDSDANKL